MALTKSHGYDLVSQKSPRSQMATVIRVSGSLGLSIELSQYPPRDADDDSPRSPKPCVAPAQLLTRTAKKFPAIAEFGGTIALITV
jgi:hypothetical protein